MKNNDLIFLPMLIVKIIHILTVLFILNVVHAYSEESTLKVIPEEMLNCTVCHGTMFRGNEATSAPALVGLPQWYIERQLLAFKSDWRGTHPKDHSGSEMYSVARQLSDSNIKIFSEYISSLPPIQEVNKLSINENGDIKKGKQVYSSCASCHGDNAEGKEIMNAPPLNYQGTWYLKNQLFNFKEGRRGYNKKDIHGMSMSNSSKVLQAEEDIDNVLSYIVNLQNN